MDSMLALVLAGGVGERLQPLTRERAKAAVPFGGKFRLIDFTLSNCINSGIRQIFVLTQYLSESLHMHIQEGWGISSSRLGDYIYCIPAQQKIGADWYRGTADAVRQNLNLVMERGPEDILLLSGDHVYKMNYSQMISYHRRKNADVTVSAIRVKKEEAARHLGVLEIDEHHGLLGFEEKPAEPKTIPGAPEYALASMGVYLFRADALREALREAGDDFGKQVIPAMLGKSFNVFIYDYEMENRIQDYVVEVKDGKRTRVLADRTRDSSYWKDVGTIDSYYEASMDLVGVDPQFNLYAEKWPFRTYQRPLPPSKFVIGGTAPESIVSDGCIISGGTAWSSVLSPAVIVERGALVEQSIIFDDVIVEPGARVRRAIVDKESRIQAGAAIGYDLEADKRSGCIVSDRGIVVVPKRSDIGPH
ncbi:MAG: glucose-1-phosphate adenylyltransferase [Chloroflexi bacterium]|nr:glucose-1-phosphate adenylyltransferase [Chloroflexota bacterium]